MGSASRTKVAAAALALLVPAGALLWHMTAGDGADDAARRPSTVELWAQDGPCNQLADDLAAYMEAHGIPTETMTEQGRRRVVWDDTDEAAAAAFDAFMDANAAEVGDASCAG